MILRVILDILGGLAVVRTTYTLRVSLGEGGGDNGLGAATNPKGVLAQRTGQTAVTHRVRSPSQVLTQVSTCTQVPPRFPPCLVCA